MRLTNFQKRQFQKPEQYETQPHRLKVGQRVWHNEDGHECEVIEQVPPYRIEDHDDPVYRVVDLRDGLISFEHEQDLREYK